MTAEIAAGADVRKNTTYSTTSATKPLKVAATATPLTRIVVFYSLMRTVANLYERIFNKRGVNVGRLTGRDRLDSPAMADGD